MDGSVDDEFKSLFLPDLEIGTAAFDTDMLFGTFMGTGGELKVEDDIWGGPASYVTIPSLTYPGYPQGNQPPITSHYHSLIPEEAIFSTGAYDPRTVEPVSGENTAKTTASETETQENDPVLEKSPDEAVYSGKTALLELFPTLLALADLTDSSNKDVQMSFSGYLNGRFLTNATSSSDTISCYRRNYIQSNLALRLSGEGIQYPLKVNSMEVLRLKISVFARSNISKDRIEVLVFEDTVPRKRKLPETPSVNPQGDNEVSITATDFEFPTPNSQAMATFVFKKLQFRNATPNNGNLSFQNFYRLHFSLSAVTAAGDVILHDLKSSPILVRGRNPSFYSLRQECLIINKTAHSVEARESKSGSPDDLTKKRSSSMLSIMNLIDDRGQIASPDPQPTPTPQSTASPSKGSGSYLYISISGAYHLPPLNVVYFPHIAHHPRQSDSVTRRRRSEATKGTERKRENPNYYFK
ncbi:hypothetical protein BABINDRAFT_158913 [Babjeviella inositovora NRRL Y-12698]|uniref:NDT80 domain-containing protein n=1 Tax=Babjeviella inositovora NRRL Y-12698 TaxID=984486 RepID=A0A1E3QX67_9ASCO|nr:uncharacterized protein BABINDRAFT_158913 [Babjeviella inositovora NRRL Y-12698]ODQ82288.1 hypothetical protein BABINDRAFT_158913 [Babjeviella inositovora NRRL Y-12698]